MSGIASWKSAALLAIVAMVAAVAFSGVLTNTQTAEAATIEVADGDNADTAAPGDTVEFTVTAELAQLTITGKADGVDASFAGGVSTIACADGTSCDGDGADNGAVEVNLSIGADSGEGYVLVKVNRLGIGSPTEVTKVITVSKAGLVGSLVIKTDAPADNTVAAAAGTSNLTVTVKNASTPPGGLTGQTVSVITTHGTVGCGSGPGSASAGSTQICSAASDADGIVDVVLTGGGVEGVATVTATLGTRTSSASVTLYGTAKNLTAKPEQGSVEIGGSVFVVLTVTDSAGNPVSGSQPQPGAPAEVAGPTKEAVLVTTSQATDDGDPATSPYNVDKLPAGADPGIPACGNAPAGDNPATEAVETDFDPFTAAGTNAAGQCVVQVNTVKAAGPTSPATTRGEHTLNFALGTLKASTTIDVAGSPNSITTDAPDSVDPGSVTEITVSVWDDTDVLVGITSVKVRKVDGGGLIEDQGADGSEMTVNGQSKFTFIAPSNAGASEILITAGTVNHRVAINIGEPAPEGPAPTWNNPLASGSDIYVWNGADGADPADAGDNILAIWEWTGSSWNGYFPAAGADGIDAGGLTELANGEAYWVVVE